MSILSRIAPELPKVAHTVLPTLIDAALAINLVNLLAPKSAKEARWIWGASTLCGIVTAGLLLRRAEMVKIPAGLIYVSWKAYQVYVYQKFCEGEKKDLQAKEKAAQNQKDHAIDLFFDALKKGNTESIEKYYQNNYDYFKLTNKVGRNALHIFAEQGFDQLVRWITAIGQRLNLNVATSEGWKPLHLAVVNGNLECVKVLLAHKPEDLKVEVPNVGNARSIAFEYGHVKIVEWLEQEKKLLDENETYPQLFEKIFSKKLKKADAIEWLYQKRQDEKLDLKELLFASVRKGHLVNAKWLVEKNNDLLKFKDESGNTLMWMALVSHQLEILHWLDEKDPSLFSQAIEGKDLSLLKIDPENDFKISKWFTERMLSKQPKNS